MSGQDKQININKTATPVLKDMSVSLTASTSQNSNRIALAPIRDARLNITSPLAQKNKRYLTSSLVDLLPLKPSSRTTGAQAASSLASPRASRAMKSTSFSEFGQVASFNRYRNITSRLHKLTGTRNGPRANSAAGIAATKLKLKLQLAFSKLGHNKLLKLKATVPVLDPSRSFTLSSSHSHQNSQSSTGFASRSVAGKNSQEHLGNLSEPRLASTEQEHPVEINSKSKVASAANINLLTLQNNQRVSMRSATIAEHDGGNESSTVHKAAKTRKDAQQTSRLKLFSIKKGSKYYSRSSNIPLAPPGKKHSRIGSLVTASSTSQASFVGGSIPQANPVQDPLIRLPKPVISQVHMEDSDVRSQSRQESQNSTNLPPIYKILKTPMKNSSSTRNLVSSYMNEQSSLTNSKSARQETTTDHADQTIPYTDDTVYYSDEEPHPKGASNSDSTASGNILSSSPVKEPNSNSFGTPNSFSVAKSLLQLGSGFYN